MKKQRFNWLHLDLKGIIPDLTKLLEWIDLFARAGFTGILWECEDRLPWKTWRGVFRPGFDHGQWREILKRCEGRGLDVMLLMQTQGHLEWLLKHEQWSHLRENGCFNELCPQHEEVLPLLSSWMDEVAALHPNVKYLHIGGDETFNLATCPRCRAIAGTHPEGRMGVYIDHIQQVTRMAIERNLRPVIWADMFWRENRMDLAERLPAQTVLVDWQYFQRNGGWETTKTLAQSGRETWGASAVRCTHALRFAVQHRRIHLTAEMLHFGYEQLEVVNRHVGVDPAVVDDYRAKREKALNDLDQWENRVHAFFIERIRMKIDLCGSISGSPAKTRPSSSATIRPMPARICPT